MFYLPDDDAETPVLVVGNLAAGFNSTDETMKVLEYLATATYAERRQSAQLAAQPGEVPWFLSAASGQDLEVYSPIQRNMVEILLAAGTSRFDASDQMPPEVGAATFWSEGTLHVNGDQDALTTATNIEASWPT